jgi:hypothetical protein
MTTRSDVPPCARCARRNLPCSGPLNSKERRQRRREAVDSDEPHMANIRRLADQMGTGRFIRLAGVYCAENTTPPVPPSRESPTSTTAAFMLHSSSSSSSDSEVSDFSSSESPSASDYIDPSIIMKKRVWYFHPLSSTIPA